MKIILLEDVKGKGKKNDVIEVADGYGKNFLIKNKLGVLYTSGSKKILDNEVKIKNEKEQKLIDDCEEIKKKLENTNLVFNIKTGKNDKVFGNISSKQICEKLKEKGYEIDKKSIRIGSPIDTLGTHKVLIILHKNVSFYINVVLSK